MFHKVLLTSILSLILSLIQGQTNEFKTYHDRVNKFSFDIPAKWKTHKDKPKNSLNVRTIIHVTADNKEDCYGKTVMTITVYNVSLDSLANTPITYAKGKSINYSDNILRQTNLMGINWNGIRFTQYCFIDCNEKYFRSESMECETIIIKKDNIIVRISTNGNKLEESILLRLFETLKFD